MKKISVIVPVYNAERFIKKSLNSIVKQTIGMNNIEVIAVNDGSTDRSLQILNRYSKKYDNIKVISQESSGSGVARNNALTHVTGEYVAFLDSDDYLPLDAYEKMYNATENGTIDIVGGKFTYLHENPKNNFTRLGAFFNKHNPNEIILDLKYNGKHHEVLAHSQAWYKICKRDLIIKYNVKFAEGILMQDVPFSVSLYLLAEKVKIINEVVYYYVKHDGSSLGLYHREKKLFISTFVALDNMYANIHKYNLSEFKHAFDYVVLDWYLPTQNKIDIFANRSCIETYRLTASEFDFVASVVRKILKNISTETLSCLNTTKLNTYLSLIRRMDDANTWDYNQSFNEGEALISIIVPFYNVEKYIRACLESLENQTLKNIEVIMVDDGSPDNSFKIAEEFAEKNTNFHLYQKKNGGLGDARNFGLGYARGDYISFLDSDDMMPPRACESLYKALIETDSDIVAGKMIWMLDNETRDVDYLNRWFTYEAGVNFRRNGHFPIGFPVACSKLYKRSLITDNNLSFPHIIGEDVPFSVQAWYYSGKIIVIPEVVYWRTEREDENNKSIMQTFNSKQIKDRMTGLKIIDEFCMKNKIKNVKPHSLRQIGYINNLFINILDKNDQEVAFKNLKDYFNSIQDNEDKYIISSKLGFELELVNSLSCEQYIKLIKKEGSKNVKARHKISIIMPIYDAKWCLKTALQSIENQTIGLSNLEVIMLNNGSTDDSKEIISEYSKKYSNFKTICLSEPVGSSETQISICVQEASGDYVMFLDPADWYEDTACETLYNRAIEHSADMGGGRLEVWREDGSSFESHDIRLFTNSDKYIDKIDEFKQFYSLAPVIGAYIFRRNFIIKNNFQCINNIIGHEMLFLVNALHLADGIFYTKTKVANYREAGSKDTLFPKSLTLDYFYSLIATQKQTYDFFCNLGKREDFSYIIYGNTINYINNLIYSSINKNEKICVLQEIHWFFCLIKNIDMWPEDTRVHYFINKVIAEEYEEAVTILDYFQHSNIRAAFTKAAQASNQNEFNMQAYSDAQIKLNEIYNSGTWRIMEKYRYFATKTKLGRFIRKILIKVFKR